MQTLCVAMFRVKIEGFTCSKSSFASNKRVKQKRKESKHA